MFATPVAPFRALNRRCAALQREFPNAKGFRFNACPENVFTGNAGLALGNRRFKKISYCVFI